MRISDWSSDVCSSDLTFAPMVDIARDQRWGRVMEGSGEDILLGNLFAAARVRGFQGDDLTADDAMLACPKPFAAYGAAEAGLDHNTYRKSVVQGKSVYGRVDSGGHRIIKKKK